MDTVSIVKQLESTNIEAIDGAFKFLTRNKETELTDLKDLALNVILEHSDKLTDAMVIFLCSEPDKNTKILYLKLFDSENITTLITALNYLEVWFQEFVDISNQLKDKLNSILQNKQQNIWVRFLSCYKLIHVESDKNIIEKLYTELSYLLKASKELEWWQSIETQAEELLSKYEFEKITKDQGHKRPGTP